MRVACLISGQPRFCKSFDLQLRHLKRSSIIDHPIGFHVALREHHYIKDNERITDWGTWD